MFAARNGHKEIVELLLKHDANYNHKDNEGLKCISMFKEYLTRDCKVTRSAAARRRRGDAFDYFPKLRHGSIKTYRCIYCCYISWARIFSMSRGIVLARNRCN